jgi:hypothetical protein
MLNFGWGPKHKQRTFDYVPRYYDPVKEELNERLKMLEEKYGEKPDLDAEKMKMRIKAGLRSRGSLDFASRKSAEKNVALKRLMIIVVLVCIFMVIMLSDKFEKMISLLDK